MSHSTQALKADGVGSEGSVASEADTVFRELTKDGSGAHSLDGLAASSRAALDAKVVVISVVNPQGEDGEVVSCGVDAALGHRLGSALDAVSPLLARGPQAVVFTLSEAAGLKDAFDWAGHGFTFSVSAALRWGEEILGTVHVIDPDPDRIGGRAEGVVPVANQIALAVAFARLSEKATRVSSEFDSVLALDELVLAATSVDEMGRFLSLRLAALIGAASCGIMVFDQERNVLQMLPGAFGIDDDNAAVSARVHIDHPVSNAARVFRTGEPYISNAARGDPGILQDYVDVLRLERLLTIPLKLGRRNLGILHFANKATPFTLQDVHRSQLLAPRIATVVELATTIPRMRRHQKANEVLVNLALGVASGEEMLQLVHGALGQFGEVIGTSVLALVPPEGRPIAWRAEGVPMATEVDLVEKAVTQSKLLPRLKEPREAGDPGSATLFVPIRLAGKHIASIATLRCRADPFIEPERAALMRLGTLIAVGWATESYQRQRAEVATLRERQRIADELHDTVAQIMFGAQIDLDSALQVETLDHTVREQVVHARGLLVRGDTMIREVIHHLSVPTAGDLSDRLTLVAEQVQEEFNVAIRLEIPAPVAESARGLRRPVVDALVKAAREAVVNAAKHAGPCTISIRLAISRRGRLLLTVTDDGHGIDTGQVRRRSTKRDGHGLPAVRRMLRESGGGLRVSANPAGGTRVLATVPL
jgi:signal transduction histidine kinase